MDSRITSSGNVMSARPKTLDFAIELANDLMDQKLRTYAERQAENKRKFDNNNQNQQQLLKKQNADITMRRAVYPSAPTARTSVILTKG
ncbi:hypothetical protein Tco_0087254 [Tanacetum coccineum]